MVEISVGESIYRIIPTGFFGNSGMRLIRTEKVVLTIRYQYGMVTKSQNIMIDLERPLTIEPRGFS